MLNKIKQQLKEINMVEKLQFYVQQLNEFKGYFDGFEVNFNIITDNHVELVSEQNKIIITKNNNTYTIDFYQNNQFEGNITANSVGEVIEIIDFIEW